MEFRKIEWEVIDDLVSRLCDWLKREKKIEKVFGIPRGGLIPAVMISHRLGIPLINQETLECDEPDNVLVVDDIYETGKTLKAYEHDCPSTTTLVALFSKIEGGEAKRPQWLNTMRDMDDDAWLVFPWEDPDKAKEDYEEYTARRVQ